jgi:hypothetical protein
MKYILLLVLGLGLMLGSCQKFLEETPTGSLTSESAITSAPGGLALASGPYRALASGVKTCRLLLNMLLEKVIRSTWDQSYGFTKATRLQVTMIILLTSGTTGIVVSGIVTFQLI